MRLRQFSLINSLILLILFSAIGFAVYYATYFWRPSDHEKESPAEGSFKIATLNVGGFRHLVEPAETANLIQYIAKENKVDIFCMQEVYLGQELTPEIVRNLFKKQFPYIIIDNDEAILSKFPIIDRKQTDFENSDNSYSWNDVKVGSDTLRLINIHFQTTGLHSAQKVMNMRKKKDPSILASVTFRNAEVRKYQAHLVQRDIYTSPHKTIIVGDFNAIPLSKAYRMIKADNIRDCFMEKGVGFGGSFRGIYDIVRIDYIMHDEGLSCYEYKTLDDYVSDHKMVTAVLKVN